VSEGRLALSSSGEFGTGDTDFYPANVVIDSVRLACR